MQTYEYTRGWECLHFAGSTPPVHALVDSVSYECFLFLPKKADKPPWPHAILHELYSTSSDADFICRLLNMRTIFTRSTTAICHAGHLPPHC